MYNLLTTTTKSLRKIIVNCIYYYVTGMHYIDFS